MSLEFILKNRVCAKSTQCNYPDDPVLRQQGDFSVHWSLDGGSESGDLLYQKCHEFPEFSHTLEVNAYRENISNGRETKKSKLYHNVNGTEVEIHSGDKISEITFELNTNTKVWTLTYSGASDAPMENVQVDVGMDDQ